MELADEKQLEACHGEEADIIYPDVCENPSSQKHSTKHSSISGEEWESLTPICVR